MKVKVFVFRHTESEDNAKNLFSGQRNVDLTPKGVAQAHEIKMKLKDEDIGLAFTSPLRRTQHCLEIVLNDHHPNVEIIIDDRIQERNYGWLSGQSKTFWAKWLYPLFKILHRAYRIPPPGGESLRSIQKRVQEFTVDMEKKIKEKKMNTVICAHSGSMRGLRQYFEKFPNSRFNKIESELGKVFIYELEV